MLRLLAARFISKSGLIFNYAKMMNAFTYGEEISKSIVIV